MNEIFDKLLLFLYCLTLYLLNNDYSFAIVPIIITIVLSSLFLYLDNYRFRIIGNILFAVICLFTPNYTVFFPLLLYDILITKYQYFAIIVPVLILRNMTVFNPVTISFTVLSVFVAFLLKYKTERLNKLTLDYNEQRDSSVKMSLLLEEKNRDLIKKQDYEINLATLNERNRISKEIHDNVGHLLSRSLLQVGALQVVAKDGIVMEGLTDLKESLSTGMDQIRSSIHNMYDESIDLYIQIENLVKNFTFCNINYDYDIKNPPSFQLKYSLISIAKEALANIIRHSNATKVNIILREHPAMYQLIIQDNGYVDEFKQKSLTKSFENQDRLDGMGLRNIYDRVKSFEGNIHITADHGFKIFISIPKKLQ